MQDKWQIRPNLTLSYGLRWDAQIEPDPLTPPDQVFFAPFIGKPGFPSTGKIPSSKKQFQPRAGHRLGSRARRVRRWSAWAAASTMRARPG